MRRGRILLQRAFAEIPGPPQWPIIGSLGDFLAVGPEIHKVHKAYYHKYGPIVQMNLAGMREVVVYDPREYLKVFQNEGPFPSGFVGDLWMVHEACKAFPYKSFVTCSGPEWREKRHAVQKDIMAPAVAATYLDAINATAVKISNRIQTLSSTTSNSSLNFRDLTKYMAFDLFCSAALGRSLNTVDPSLADPQDMQFVENSVGALNRTMKLFQKPYAQSLPDCLKPKEFGELKEMYMGVFSRGAELVRVASAEVARVDQEIDEHGPIVHRMLARGLDEEVVAYELGGLLGGAVDTTQHVVLWLLLNMASHPDVQRTLAAELDTVLKGGNYSKDVKKQLPYLQAVIRESHRRNHTNPLITMRRLDSDIELAGYHIPAGTRISFNGSDMQQDPAVVEHPELFMPERFMPDAVEKRAEDPFRSIIDHRLLAAPFGHGARMCVGARVAENEIWALMCRIFQDFELSLDPPDQTWKITMPFMTVADPFPSIRVSRRA